MKHVTLEISSWVGVSIGAQHAYGSLHFYDAELEYRRIRLSRKLTKETAEKLNEQRNEDRSDNLARFVSGDETECFDTYAHVRRTAKRVWKALCPDAVVLLEGSWAVCDPQKCIAGPDEIRKEINRLYRKGVAIGGYEGDEAAMDRIFKEYQAYISYGRGDA